MKNTIKIIAIFIIVKIMWPILKRLAWASWCLSILIAIYSFGWISRALAFSRERLIEYAQSIQIVKGGNYVEAYEEKPAGELAELSDFLKTSETVTVRSIRDLGFSANKSANLRKNLEKFGVIRTNPQLDNRGEVVMNPHGIDDVLGKVGEDLFLENPIMIN